MRSWLPTSNLLLLLLAGCTTGVEQPRSTVQTNAVGESLYVAIASASDKDETPLSLDVSAPAKTWGVIVCPNGQARDCTSGKGSFHTTDHSRDLQGRRIYRTNVAVKPEDQMTLVVVAHDQQGVVLGASTIQLKKQ